MIRPYAVEDTDRLIALWWAASAVAHPFLTRSFLEQEATRLRTTHLANAQTWVTELNGVPAGFVSLLDNEIGGLFLDPRFHRRGHGTAMVDYAYQKKGPLTVEVFERNDVGRRFYDRYGFVETDRYAHRPTGERMLRMAMIA